MKTTRILPIAADQAVRRAAARLSEAAERFGIALLTHVKRLCARRALQSLSDRTLVDIGIPRSGIDPVVNEAFALPARNESSRGRRLRARHVATAACADTSH